MGKGDKPEVQIGEVKLGKVWDKKACSEAESLLQAALEKALSDVKVVTNKPKQGFILKVTLDLDYDEKREELSGEAKVIVMDQDKSMKGQVSTKGKLPKVGKDDIEKKLKTLIGAMAGKLGKDASGAVAEAAEEAAANKK
jgi:hypothetical protein